MLARRLLCSQGGGGPSAAARAAWPLLVTQRRPLAAQAAGRVVVAGSEQPAAARKRAPRKAALELTESAARRISDLLSRRSDQEAIAVRIGVKTRGCNGMSYTMDYATDKAKFEEEEARRSRPPRTRTRRQSSS